MSSPIARLVVRHLHEPVADSATPTIQDDSGRPTAREQEILDLLAQGLRTKEIAARLCISPQTVQTHVRNIYEKLHVRSRVEAVLKYHRG